LFWGPCSGNWEAYEESKKNDKARVRRKKGGALRKGGRQAKRRDSLPTSWKRLAFFQEKGRGKAGVKEREGKNLRRKHS